MHASGYISILIVATGLAASAACTSDSVGSEPEIRDAGNHLDGTSASADSGPDVTSPKDATTDTKDEESADDGPLVCVDASNGRTKTDACVPQNQPCTTACDCCFYEFGSDCPAGVCIMRHTQ